MPGPARLVRRMSTSFNASTSPSKVAASEHALLSIARALVGEAGAEVEPVLRRARPNSPRTMGPTACALLEQTLARGVTMELMRRGGWRRESFVTGTSVERGRAFERHSKVPLRFTRVSFDLLAWLRDVDVATPSRPFSHRASAALSLGDEVVAYLALDLLKPSDGAAHQPVFQNSPLCWLGHVGTLSRHATPARRPRLLAARRPLAARPSPRRTDRARVPTGRPHRQMAADRTREGDHQEHRADVYARPSPAARTRCLPRFGRCRRAAGPSRPFSSMPQSACCAPKPRGDRVTTRTARPLPNQRTTIGFKSSTLGRPWESAKLHSQPPGPFFAG